MFFWQTMVERKIIKNYIWFGLLFGGYNDSVNIIDCEKELKKSTLKLHLCHHLEIKNEHCTCIPEDIYE